MRRCSLFLLVLAALVAPLAACGDDGADSADGDRTTTTAAGSNGSADEAELDELIETLTGDDGPGLSEDDARCVGEAVLPNLSEKGKKTLDDGDLEDLPADEQDVVFTAFDDCVDTADFAARLAQEISSGEDALSAETAECIEAAVVAEYPKSGDLMRIMTSDSGEEAFTSLITDCIPEGEIEQQLVDQFVSSGFSPEQAQCIAAGLSGRISADDLVEAAEGDMSPEVEQIITEATTSCVAGG